MFEGVGGGGGGGWGKRVFNSFRSHRRRGLLYTIVCRYIFLDDTVLSKLKPRARTITGFTVLADLLDYVL